MTDRDRNPDRPLEESPEVAAAVEDETTVPQLVTGGEQPWEPADLARARGQEPTPENVERARRDLARDGRAAIERTVP